MIGNFLQFFDKIKGVWESLGHFVESAFPLQDPVLVFSLILLIILLSPILLRRINIPGIIGLIISGVVIGPFGLGIIEKSSAIDLFSKIGILYIMFIAGLELDLNEFKANRNKSLVFSFFTFAIPLAIGYPVCFYFLGYDFNASLLTASMFATHTLVAYPIVSKFGISKNQAVAITVGGTILTDTAVLIILAVIIENSKGELSQDFWIQLGISLIIFSIIMFLIIPRVAKWFFQKLESEKHSHYIFVLSVVFFAAFLAEVAGIEDIIGAFVAGLALNKLIPNSSALMNRIEFIGNSLFIPFFLISVGMIVDVRVILSGPGALIIAGTLTVVALVGKWLAALFTQWTLKYTKAQRQLIFGLSGAHAAATLAIILVGHQAGVIDDNILNGTVILILIACVVASFATEKAAKQIVLESENDNTDLIRSSGAADEHILVCIDHIENLSKLLELSILIKDKSSQNPISILNVVSINEESEINILKARNKLDEFVKEGSATETNIKILTTIDHNVPGGIARVSRETMADILVLGWPTPRSFLEKLIGEKIEGILSSTDKTTFICYLDKPLSLHKRIIVAVPPLAEFEKGFNQWLIKTAVLAQELSVPIRIYCNELTDKAVKRVFENAKLTASLSTVHFTEWESFSALSENVHEDDLFILVSARKSGASYMSILENVPNKLERHFNANSRLIVYPQEYSREHAFDRFEDVSADPLNKSIETIQKLGKGLGHFWKKDGE